MEVPPLVVDRSASQPLAAQVASGLRAAAARGTLAAGSRLPSTRELARLLGTSRTVTAAAYDQLLAEGWVAARRGVGTFVVALPAAVPGDRPVLPPAPPPSTSPRPPARRETVDGGGTGVGEGLLDLRAGAPCTEVLERAAWRRAWRAAGGRAPDVLPDPRGDAAFRAAVAEHLLRHRGLPAGPEDVTATTGTSAAVAEVAALLPRGARVAVEDPGYRRSAAALRAAGVELVPVPVDDDGMVVDAVPGGVAAVVCTPAHQFPTGGRLPVARRAHLVARARAEGFLVLEDDYDGELRYDVAPLPLLASLGPDVVVHLGTTSKTVSPTLGAGWLVAPEPLRRRLLAARTETGVRPPRAGQRVLAELAASGDLARHLRRLRRELGARRDLVVAAVEAAGRRAQGGAAGAHVLVPLRSREQEDALVARARAHGVVVGPLADSCLSAGRAGVVVGWGAPRRADLERGLERLTAALEDRREIGG